jgi:GntR family transcriptional regulator/MocR family aminotransferase
VIYLGTFSKSIGAGLRTGYMVLPHGLLDAAQSVKRLTNYGHPWVEQIALADFLRSGFDTHLRRIRRCYADARDVLIEQLRKSVGPVDIWGAENGMHVMWRLPKGFPEADTLAAQVRQYGVEIHTLQSGGARDFGSPYSRDSILLGYSSLSTDEIVKGVRAIAQAITDLNSHDHRPTPAGPPPRASPRVGRALGNIPKT